MNAPQETKQAIHLLKKDTHRMAGRLCDLSQALAERADSLAWQEMPASRIASTKIFTAAEAEAIVFILAETGGDLDSVDHWLIFGW